MKNLLILTNLYLAYVAANQPSNSQSLVGREKDSEIRDAVEKIIDQVESEIKARNQSALSKRYYYGPNQDLYRVLMEQYYHRSYAIVRNACYKNPTIYKRSVYSKNDREVKAVQKQLGAAWLNLIENQNSLSRRNVGQAIKTTVDDAGRKFTNVVDGHLTDAAKRTDEGVENISTGKGTKETGDGHLTDAAKRTDEGVENISTGKGTEETGDGPPKVAATGATANAAKRTDEGAFRSATKILFKNLKPISAFILGSVVIYTIIQSVIQRNNPPFPNLDSIQNENSRFPNEVRWWG